MFSSFIPKIFQVFVSDKILSFFSSSKTFISSLSVSIFSFQFFISIGQIINFQVCFGFKIKL